MALWHICHTIQMQTYALVCVPSKSSSSYQDLQNLTMDGYIGQPVPALLILCEQRQCYKKLTNEQIKAVLRSLSI